MQIPKLSAPLVKDIRTGEGIFEWALAALIAASAVTDKLSFGHSATYITILAGIKAIRRCLLKLVAAQGVVGIGEPIVPPLVNQISPETVQKFLSPQDLPLDSSVAAGPAAPENAAQGT